MLIFSYAVYYRLMKFQQHRIQREDRSDVSQFGSSIYINSHITLFLTTFYSLHINDLMLQYIFIAENSFYSQYFFQCTPALFRSFI